jgi:hypothetical protein
VTFLGIYDGSILCNQGLQEPEMSFIPNTQLQVSVKANFLIKNVIFLTNSITSATRSKNKQKQKRQDLWFLAINRPDLRNQIKRENFIKYMRICNKHFTSGAPASLADIDNIDWIPNLNMGYEKLTKAECEKLKAQINRALRAAKVSLKLNIKSTRGFQNI